MPTRVQQMQTFKGLALFSAGFRPFFLASSAWSALMVPLWVWIYSGQGGLGGVVSVAWHAHEMIFGVVGGVIAGFLLTAVPNWTGRLPVTGWPLTVLFALWAFGRLAMMCPERDSISAAVTDSAFLVIFAVVIWREIIVGRNWRNLPVAIMLSFFALANVLFHAGLTALSERFALAIILSLVTLIGGRIIPSFTTNWLKKAGDSRLPKPFGGFDRVVLTVTAMALLLWASGFLPLVTGSALILSGGLNLVRLGRWRGLATGREALVWILHVGYAWLVPGLVLLGLADLVPSLPMQSGLHALTAGAIGVMILAVMTRASLGHTGRALHAGSGTATIYILANLAAILRVAAPLLPAWYLPALVLSSLLWAGAFGGFVVVYGRRLWSPRSAKNG